MDSDFDRFVIVTGGPGSGKSTLTQLVNRAYDVTRGRVLIDGVDVRDWDLNALRSQISTIEQDIFLFSRTIAENIAYGLGDQADRAADAVFRLAVSARAMVDGHLVDARRLLAGDRRQKAVHVVEIREF